MLSCPICSKNLKQITNTHIKSHGLSVKEFKDKFPNLKLTSKETINKWRNKQPEKELLKKFLINANSKWGEKYEYSTIDFVDMLTKISIKCPIHGLFKQTPRSHLLYECSKCGNDSMGRKQQLTNEEFISKAKKVHGDKFDYSKTNYISHKDKVEIICPIHGIFKQKANNHLTGYGCYMCTESKGEKRIKEILTKYNIKFEQEKKFDNCTNKRHLPFDFYLIELNSLIEFDGAQHFKEVALWGEKLNYIKLCDSIKNKFAKENNISLLRIRYNEYNKIEELIFKFISQIA